MAWKPISWSLRLAFVLGFTAINTSAFAADPAPLPRPAGKSAAPIHSVIAPAAAVEPKPVVAGPQAAPIDDAATEAAPEPTENSEVIRERHPNTAIKVERHVTQDAEGNYYNHGLWTQWDDKGRLVGSGEYRYGKRHGRWLRWFNANEAQMLTGPMFQGFQPPFIAETTFEDGTINGVWKVIDSKNRKMLEWEFDHGERHGKSVWYHPNGQKRREVEYRDGQIDGLVVEWAADTRVTLREKYIEGRRLAAQVDNHAPGQKRAEGWVLHAREITKADYDFWNGTATIKVVGTEGVNQRHGLWTWWYKNGQKQMEGRYEADMPVGKFTWWYPNGQKQLQGEYLAGKQQGKFVWWHANGQKQLEGAYLAGTLSGKWTRWNADGRVVEVGDYSEGQALAQEPGSLHSVQDGTPTLQAVQPQAPNSSRLKR